MPNDDKIEKILELVCPQIKHAKCTHKKDGKWYFWYADSGLAWCSSCGKCLNGRYEWEPGFNAPPPYWMR